MAFTVHTSDDASPAGLEFGDGDRYTIYGSGVLKVESTTYGTRIYSPGFWQILTHHEHDEANRTIYGVDL